MADQLRTEWLKLVTGRMWWILLASGTLMSGITSYGYAVAGDEAGTAAAVVTADVVRAWMMMFLFSAIFAAVVHTRDVGSGALARTVIVSGGNRPRVFWTKVAGAAVAGTGFGTLAAVLSLASVLLFVPLAGIPIAWTGDAILSVVGVFACSVLAAVFGLFVGMVLRNGAAASAALLLMTLLLDPGLQRLVPGGAKYLFTIALSAVYRDPKPQLLSMWGGALIATAWIVAIGLIGQRLFYTRDVE